MKCVLDASALLAYLHRERGWRVVRALVGESCIGAVNWCEVAQKTRQQGLLVDPVRSSLEEIGLVITPFCAAQADIAAQLWEATRRQGLSLADRACLALAMWHKISVLTADRVWAELGLDVEIQLLR